MHTHISLKKDLTKPLTYTYLKTGRELLNPGEHT